jgi:hypothetical protein
VTAIVANDASRPLGASSETERQNGATPDLARASRRGGSAWSVYGEPNASAARADAGGSVQTSALDGLPGWALRLLARATAS